VIFNERRDWDKVDCCVKDMIRECLRLDPEHRITAENALNH